MSFSICLSQEINFFSLKVLFAILSDGQRTLAAKASSFVKLASIFEK